MKIKGFTTQKLQKLTAENLKVLNFVQILSKKLIEIFLEVFQIG